MTPILGKLAIDGGLSPTGVAAWRTVAAAGLLFLVVLATRPRNLYIYPVGLIGCLLAGGLNGIGSLLYYGALARLDAGLAQLLYAFYPILVALLLLLDGQGPTRQAALVLALCIPAAALLLRPSARAIDGLGAAMMLGASLLYAVHIPINQRVLFEAPAPTVTLYTLLAMAAVVLPAHVVLSPAVFAVPAASVGPLLGLTAVTFFSRLTLFSGVKLIGGLRTSVLGLLELLVAVTLAHWLLKESLAPTQWLGAALLVTALLLSVPRPLARPTPRARGWLHWLTPPALAAAEPPPVPEASAPAASPAAVPGEDPPPAGLD
jgi:drug/metabolite transporter (DMT)-like permease